ncbi:sigma 54-interacting transcriptional regulator [Sinanaerobacter chloroacetimidivorans]|uniref:Sigma 54-interacting transcriptional regulator n=1 Tax=Sinanaerobacter chloroacetimidivorans TaxID=2818044 RepID=A0A8J7VYQ9_9FIRM|nr:sigma 54-interacting transcriptional regulator [Sinanaerobacter chloroacetimidivorans]MBR0597587.1 sigma 54-interacting transcriptional regulator [Sinanaerobacter chloroacetimidivorans]
MINIAMMFPWSGFFHVAEEVIRADKDSNRKNQIAVHDGEDIEYTVEEILVPNNIVDMEKIKDIDVIISRGITAAIIKRQVGDIPVVEIPVVGNDLVRSLFEAKKRYGNYKTGVIGSERMIYGVEGMAEIVGMELRPYFRQTPDDAKERVDEAIADGCKIIVGGVKSCSYAEEMGLCALVIRTGKEAFWQALREAKRAAQISLVEQAKAKRVQAILDYAQSGILEVDNNGYLTVCNVTAQEMLGLDNDAIGKPVKSVIQQGMLLELIEKKEPCKDELVKYGNITMTVNLAEVKVKNKATGLVVTSEDITRVQQMEGVIRKKINTKGYVAKHNFDSIIGKSEAILETIENAKRFAVVDSDVLILGNSGTGKELFAQSIHNFSNRNMGPFVAINCAAIQANLLESELFGYVEGAFTGAMKGGKQGLFEQAHGGTIFLDEIAEMPIDLQSKLLRVLEEREVMRLGDDKIIPIDIRVVAATNKKLSDFVKKNLFREDLYYRLDVLTIKLPDLSERGKDVSLIADHFINKYGVYYGMPNIIMMDNAKEVLEKAEWKGNVRQLKNICTRAIVLNKSGIIDANEMSRLLQAADCCVSEDSRNVKRPILMDKEDADRKEESLTLTEHAIDGIEDIFANCVNREERFEAARIMNALELCNYNRTGALEMLGMSRATLWRKMKKYWPQMK